MKRIKKVFSSSSQVFHLWANQTQSDARQAGRITRAFFEGESAYSYGHHYEVGRFVKYKGKTVAIVNNSGYSNTTSKHIGEAYSALQGLKNVISLEAKTFDVRKALVENQGALIDGIMAQFSRRSFWKGSKFFDKRDLERFQEFNSKCVALGHSELVLKVPAELNSLGNEHIKYRLQRAQELLSPENTIKREQARQKREELKALKEKQSIEAWQRGDGNRTESVRQLEPQLIRIKGDRVETSRGAEVPLLHAVTALRLIESGDAAPGMRIGSFEFGELNEEGIVRIGCHRIDLSHAKEVLGSQVGFRLIRGEK